MQIQPRELPRHILAFDTHTCEDTSRPVRALPELHLLRAGAAAASARIVEVDDLCVLCVSASDVGERSRRTRDGRGAPRLFGSDAARTHQGPARREALERRLRAEGTAGKRLDHEIRERLAHELRHAIAFTRSDHVRKAYLSPSAATALAEKLREHNYANDEPAKIEVLYLYV